MKTVKTAAVVAPAVVAPAAVVAPDVVLIDSKAFTPHSLNARWNDVLCALVQSHGNQWAITALCKAEFNTYKVDPRSLPPAQLGDYIKGVAAYLTAIGYGPCVRHVETIGDCEKGSPVLDVAGQRQPLGADAFGALVGKCKVSLCGNVVRIASAKKALAVVEPTTEISGIVARDRVNSAPVNPPLNCDGTALASLDEETRQMRIALSVAEKCRGDKDTDKALMAKFIVGYFSALM